MMRASKSSNPGWRTLFFSLLLAAGASAKPWAGAFNWNQTADLYPGIKFTALTNTAAPRRMVLQVLRIDTANLGIRFVTGGRHAQWLQPMAGFPQDNIRSGRQTTRDFLAGFRAKGQLSAIMALPFPDQTAISTKSFNPNSPER